MQTAKILEKKAQIQYQALQALLANNGGLYIMPTRSGKTKVAIDFLKEKQVKQVLIVVPGVAQKKSWQDELYKWKFNGIANIVTYQYMAQANFIYKKVLFENYDYNALVLDEIHHITPSNFENIQAVANNVEYIVGFTATYPEQTEKKSLIQKLGLKIIFQYHLYESIKDKINRPFNINVIYITLSDIPSDKYKLKGIKRSEKYMYEYYSQRIYSAKTKKEKEIWIRKRAWLIYTAQNKIRAVKLISDGMLAKNNRHIVFLNDKNSLNQIDSYNSVHSGKQKFLNELIIREYNEGKRNRILIARIANEGVEFKNTKYIIFGAMNRSSITNIQRLGRVLNIMTNQGEAEIYFVVLKDTIEENWFNLLLKKVNKKPKNKFKYENGRITRIK